MVQEKPQSIVEVQREIQNIEGRDSQLWSIGAVVFLVTAAGFSSMILPNLAGNLENLEIQGRYLPQLILGFITLIILFNAYVLEQRRLLRKTREVLVSKLVQSEANEQLALMDPLTELYNRRYMDSMLSKEVSRTDRASSCLTLLMIDVDGFKAVNDRFGHLEGDRFLNQIAMLLKRTFRNSDTVFRYGGDEFLVLMPDTHGERAPLVVDRLEEEVARWNQENSACGYEMSLSCGFASYSTGDDLREILQIADKQMYQNKYAEKIAS